MAFRDENEALRARIGSLEAQLEEQGSGDEEGLQSTHLAGSSPLSKGTIRHTKTLPGYVSAAGFDELRHLLWAKLGAADENKDGKDDDAPPGEVVLRHARGKRSVHVVQSAGQTHLSIDHRRFGFVQSTMGIALLGALMTAGMFATGVHHDWMQLTMGCYAVAVVLLGPMALLRSWSHEADSVDLLEDAAQLAMKHTRTAVRVESRQAKAGGDAEEELIDQKSDWKATQRA